MNTVDSFIGLHPVVLVCWPYAVIIGAILLAVGFAEWAKERM